MKESPALTVRVWVLAPEIPPTLQRRSFEAKSVTGEL